MRAFAAVCAGPSRSSFLYSVATEPGLADQAQQVDRDVGEVRACPLVRLAGGLLERAELHLCPPPGTTTTLSDFLAIMVGTPDAMS